jgi:hypothetical protein
LNARRFESLLLQTPFFTRRNDTRIYIILFNFIQEEEVVVKVEEVVGRGRVEILYLVGRS